MANTMKVLNQHLSAARNELRKASEMEAIDDAGDNDMELVKEHMRLAGNHLHILEQMQLEELAKRPGPKSREAKADDAPSQAKESVG